MVRPVSKSALGMPHAPTALICVEDHFAVEYVHLARKRGIAVPEQLSIVGFNDVAFRGLERPKLTRMVGNLSNLGREGVRLLIESLEVRAPYERHVLLPLEFKEGETTARIT